MKNAYLDDPRIVDTLQVVVEWDKEERILQVPTFNLKYLEPGNCSGYVRLAAQKLFGKEYSYPCATWERKIKDRLVTKVESFKELRYLSDEQVLVPGMGIGFYNPLNRMNGEKDERGNLVDLTHFTLFLGKSTLDNDLVVAHQYGSNTCVETLGNFKKNWKKSFLSPRELIDSAK